MKGMAHIGVWRALEEREIRIDAIIGTSVGSLIGAMIAHGLRADELEAIARTIKKDDVVQVNRRIYLPGGIRQLSLFSGRRLQQLIARVVPTTSFSDLKIPLRINAVSLTTGEEFWFGHDTGNVLPLPQAIYASCALPLYFPPLEWNGHHLSDGALRTALGINEALRWGATTVIASAVHTELRITPNDWISRGMIAVHDRTMQILADERKRHYRSHRRKPRNLFRG